MPSVCLVYKPYAGIRTKYVCMLKNKFLPQRMPAYAAVGEHSWNVDNLIICSFINHRYDFSLKYFCYFVRMLCVPIETDVNILNFIFGLLYRLMYLNNNISNNIIMNHIYKNS